MTRRERRSLSCSLRTRLTRGTHTTGACHYSKQSFDYLKCSTAKSAEGGTARLAWSPVACLSPRSRCGVERHALLAGGPAATRGDDVLRRPPRVRRGGRVDARPRHDLADVLAAAGAVDRRRVRQPDLG